MTKTKPTALKIGALIARAEAPTVRYRITSITPNGTAHCLPYQAQGREVFVLLGVDHIVGDGSIWKVAA